MLHGALVVIEKNKNKERQIEDAIQAGIRLYQKHNPKFPALELIAYVSPRIQEECIGEQTFSIDVDVNPKVPYALLWVCRKGKDND